MSSQREEDPPSTLEVIALERASRNATSKGEDDALDAVGKALRKRYQQRLDDAADAVEDALRNRFKPKFRASGPLADERDATPDRGLPTRGAAKPANLKFRLQGKPSDPKLTVKRGSLRLRVGEDDAELSYTKLF